MTVFKFKTRMLCVIVVLMSMLMSSVSFADDNKLTRVSLKGIDGAQLKLRVSSQLKQAGLTDERIKKDVEEKLDTAGFKILNETDRTKSPGRPLFEVRVKGSKLSKPKIYIYDINLLLVQDVILKRDPEIILSSATWSKKITGKSDAIDDIYDLVNIGMDMFLKSYGYVNQK